MAFLWRHSVQRAFPSPTPRIAAVPTKGESPLWTSRVGHSSKQPRGDTSAYSSRNTLVIDEAGRARRWKHSARMHQRLSLSAATPSWRCARVRTEKGASWDGSAVAGVLVERAEAFRTAGSARERHHAKPATRFAPRITLSAACNLGTRIDHRRDGCPATLTYLLTRRHTRTHRLRHSSADPAQHCPARRSVPDALPRTHQSARAMPLQTA